mmetsp:Transcript_27082/g.74339  ORF Transcript_27082/g.74339 Transcript_27082/m.74339 type:complete len:88 (+) Transcript_27082:670-933(+)
MGNLERVEELINREASTTRLIPTAVRSLMPVVGEVREAFMTDALDARIESITGRELGLIQTMFSIEGNTGLALDKTARIVMRSGCES